MQNENSLPHESKFLAIKETAIQLPFHHSEELEALLNMDANLICNNQTKKDA